METLGALIGEKNLSRRRQTAAFTLRKVHTTMNTAQHTMQRTKNSFNNCRVTWNFHFNSIHITQSINWQIIFFSFSLLFLHLLSTYRTTEKHNLLSVNPKTKWEENSILSWCENIFPRFRPFFANNWKNATTSLGSSLGNVVAQQIFSHSSLKSSCVVMILLFPDKENSCVEGCQRSVENEKENHGKLLSQSWKLSMLVSHCQG